MDAGPVDQPGTSDGRQTDPHGAALARFLNNISDSSSEGEGEARRVKPQTGGEGEATDWIQRSNQIFPCHLCPSTWFQTEKELGHHRETTHQIHSIKRHKCPQCAASFDRCPTLRDHIRRFHSGRHQMAPSLEDSKKEGHCSRPFAFEKA